MVDRYAQRGPRGHTRREHAPVAGHLQIDRRAQEGETPVLLQRAGQQVGFGEHLKAVADADHRAAGGGERRNRRHDRREAGDRPRAQVVAMGETPGEHDRIKRPERPVTMPDDRRFGARVVPGPPPRRTRSWNREIGPRRSGRSRRRLQVTVESSITGLASRRRQRSSTSARAEPSSSASTTKRNALPARTPEMPLNPNAGRARSMVAPCGSAMPGRKRHLDEHGKSRHPVGRPAAVDRRLRTRRRGQSAETQTRQPLVGLHVTVPGGLHHIRGQGRRGRRLVPARRLQPVAQRLLVECRRGPSRLPLIGRPEAGGVGRQHLVADGQAPVDDARTRTWCRR